MSKKIRLGILGGGGNSLIGVLHRIATNMFDKYEIVGGVFNPNFDENITFAKTIGLNSSRVYKDYETLIFEECKLDSSERMQAISVLTPNFLHYPMAKQLLENDFHVICEKPLTISYQEALDLKRIKEEKNAVFGVTHTYTGYPMVRQMTKMISDGIIGKIQKVDAQYLQGWLNPIIHEKDKRSSTWRLDPEKSGPSCCLGDIGTHAFNMVELVTGMKVNKLLADLNTLYEDNPMDIDANILIQFSNNAKGTIRSSQIATGEENNIRINVYGSKGALKWEQENPNYLYHLSDDKPLQVLKPGHLYNSDISLDGTKLPPGHPEGIFDAMGNIYKGVARAINGESFDKAEFPPIEDGVRGMDFIEKALESNSKGNVWVELNK
ncbi:MAG: Gfo/Idh/MocA family oxidoreductase [Flavobacteriaceae bacterium]|nr:Gfo/Idh/MocA family oxidoreductase [Flavobacteriaceae bacterium]